MGMIGQQRPGELNEEELFPGWRDKQLSRVKIEKDPTLRTTTTELGMPKLLENTCNDSKGHIREQEKLWHRTAAVLLASGWSKEQVAEHIGMSVASVRDLFNTDWFQVRVNKLLEERSGFTDVLALVKEKALKAHQVMIEILENKEMDPRLRFNVAQEVMARVYGKPVAKVETDLTVHSTDPVQEVSRLEQERKSLLGQLN